MKCPKCDAAMVDIDAGGVTVQRCCSCAGLFFDRSKHEYLKGLDEVPDIDKGDAEMGKVFNRKGDIFCPDCSAPMINMVVADQPHIWYESCSKCFAVFFDAGEFKDFAEKDILDFFKSFTAEERK